MLLFDTFLSLGLIETISFAANGTPIIDLTVKMLVKTKFKKEMGSWAIIVGKKPTYYMSANDSCILFQFYSVLYMDSI